MVVTCLDSTRRFAPSRFAHCAGLQRDWVAAWMGLRPHYKSFEMKPLSS